MAPCNRRCSLCPFKNPALPDRALRATYFAAIYLRAAVPSWHPHLDCVINCVSKMREVGELFNCCDDYKKLYKQKTWNPKCQQLGARQLKQLANTVGLLSSIFTPMAVFGGWGLLPIGRYTGWADTAAKVMSASEHMVVLAFLFVDAEPRTCEKSTAKTLNAIAECSYYLLELKMEEASVGVQAAIGVPTGVWGLWKALSSS